MLYIYISFTSNSSDFLLLFTENNIKDPFYITNTENFAIRNQCKQCQVARSLFLISNIQLQEILCFGEKLLCPAN